MKTIVHSPSFILSGLLGLLAQLSTLNPQLASAQYPPPDSFNPDAGGGGVYDAYSLVVQADGKILVGGSFSTLGGQTRNGIGRLNADGTLDSAFDPGVGGVYSLAVQADGKILVGGSFSTLGGRLCSGFGRLNADGTLDFAYHTPFDQYIVRSLVVQADGKILVGSIFTWLSGAPPYYLCRLNADGTLDSAFAHLIPPWEESIYSIAVQADGKILVGGDFTTLHGQPRNGIGRLNADGTLDSGFNPGMGVVYSLAVQADGKILAGGSFTKLGGQPRSGIGRLNADGTLDGAFDPGVSGTVYSLVVQADGKILVGGYFTTLGGQPRNGIGRLNADGTLDSAFDAGAEWTVNSIAVQADGKILVSGHFSSLGGQPRNGIGRLNNTAPATQSLSYDGSKIIWVRGGTSPEVCYTRFDFSTNGLTWTSLGTGTRIAGGWRRLGVSFPPHSILRAQGYVSGSYNNGSGWFVEAYYGMPVFLLQPASRTNQVGTPGTFSVIAGGSEPFSFQWRKDGVPLMDGGNIAGAATALLSLTNLLGANAGGYSVVVSNGFGSVTSVVARLTVVDPVIAVQPVSQNGNAGQSVTFSVTAVGTEPLRYQWRKDSVPLLDSANVGGAATAALSLTNLLRASAGAYSVVVSNGFGSVTSVVATLSVNDPVIAVQPLSQNGNAGQSVTFSVTVAGTEPLRYQWYEEGGPLVDGGNIAGTTTARLRLANVLGSDAGGFSVVVSNGFGSVTSVVARLTVIDPVIAVQPLSQNGNAGQSVTFSVTAVGTEPLRYQWRKDSVQLVDGANIAGAATAVLRLINLLRVSVGDYSVVVSNGFGSATSAVATLLVGLTPPVILTGDGAFGVISNQFGFNVSGVSSQVVIVERSSNLLQWLPLHTNTLGSSPVYFSDPGWSQSPHGFYRARLVR